MTEPKRIRLVKDPRLKPFDIGESGMTVLVTGPAGVGKTLSYRPFLEKYGTEEGMVVATDPRLMPLAGLEPPVQVLEGWLKPGADGLALKQSATEAYNNIQSLFIDMAKIVEREDVEFPKSILFDSLSNYGDVMQARLCPPGGRMSLPLWGQVGDEILRFVSWVRGFQRRGLMRVFTCITAPAVDSKGEAVRDEMGRPVLELLIGTGGKMAAKHVRKHFDLFLHVESRYAPGDEHAGPDGMVREFHTCEHDGIPAKGHPALPTPTCPADLGYVYERILGGGDSPKH